MQFSYQFGCVLPSFVYSACRLPLHSTTQTGPRATTRSLVEVIYSMCRRMKVSFRSVQPKDSLLSVFHSTLNGPDVQTVN